MSPNCQKCQHFVIIFGIAMRNAFKKCANMPCIGSLIREIDVNISEVWESKQPFAQ